MSEIKLPEMPEVTPGKYGFHSSDMQDYALAAIELDRQGRGAPWMPVESCPGGNGVRYLFVRDCGQGTLPAVEMGYMLDDDTEVYMDSTHGPFTKYGYRVTHWMRLPGLPNTPQPAAPVVKESLTVAEPVKEVSDEKLIREISNGITELAKEDQGVRALLASYGKAAQPSLPKGWKLVPVGPDWDMEMAGIQKMIPCTSGELESYGEKVLDVYREEVAEIYRAMLAAAPTPLTPHSAHRGAFLLE